MLIRSPADFAQIESYLNNRAHHQPGRETVGCADWPEKGLWAENCRIWWLRGALGETGPGSAIQIAFIVTGWRLTVLRVARPPEIGQ